MRVITGAARGRNLETLEGEDITRPTSQATKEALFSSIQFELEGARILDLFAGCGQLGIEALSRGARFCTFVESNRSAHNIVRRNIDRCGMSDTSLLVLSDARAFLHRHGTFDIAFLDPPYKSGLIDECLPDLTQSMCDNGIIICETARDEILPDCCNGWHITKQKNYGKAMLTYYRKEVA